MLAQFSDVEAPIDYEPWIFFDQVLDPKANGKNAAINRKLHELIAGEGILPEECSENQMVPVNL